MEEKKVLEYGTIKFDGREIEPRLEFRALSQLSKALRVDGYKAGEDSSTAFVLRVYSATGLSPENALLVIYYALKREIKIAYDEFLDKVDKEKWDAKIINDNLNTAVENSYYLVDLFGTVKKKMSEMGVVKEDVVKAEMEAEEKRAGRPKNA